MEVDNKSVELWLVVVDGKPTAAYPRKIQAKVYASGYSSATSTRIEIIHGMFTELRVFTEED